MIETRQSVVVMSQEGGDVTKVFFKMMCERGFHRLVQHFHSTHGNINTAMISSLILFVSCSSSAGTSGVWGTTGQANVYQQYNLDTGVVRDI